VRGKFDRAARHQVLLLAQGRWWETETGALLTFPGVVFELPGLFASVSAGMCSGNTASQRDGQRTIRTSWMGFNVRFDQPQAASGDRQHRPPIVIDGLTPTGGTGQFNNRKPRTGVFPATRCDLTNNMGSGLLRRQSKIRIGKIIMPQIGQR